MSGAGRIIATITVDLDADGRVVTVHNVAPTNCTRWPMGSSASSVA
jgi:RNA polymerase sigma-70 factor (ECF subfamily)